LRDRTNAPFGDCKKALVEADGDMDKAIEILRKKNTAIQAKASGRETGDGRVGLWVSEDGSTGGLIDLRCESAPVAKNEMFVELATDLAKQVAMKGVAGSAQAMVDEAHHSQAGKTVKERIADVVGLLRENIQPHRMGRYEGGQVGGYVHHDGTVGVLVHCEGTKSDQALLRDVAMHIVARTPMAISRDKVDPALIEREREVSKAQAAESSKGKPANIVEKIAENRLNTWLKESVLEEQPFVKDESKTVGELLKAAGLKLVSFTRFKVGEATA
jgi:elongation factor Ts